MIRSDYQCRECGKVKVFTFDNELPACTDHWCCAEEGTTRWDRKWTAPHTGKGSSGEPPR